MTGRIMTFISWKPFSHAGTSFFANKLFFLGKATEFRSETSPSNVFFQQVSIEQIYYAFAEKPNNLF